MAELNLSWDFFSFSIHVPLSSSWPRLPLRFGAIFLQLHLSQTLRISFIVSVTTINDIKKKKKRSQCVAIVCNINMVISNIKMKLIIALMARVVCVYSRDSIQHLIGRQYFHLATKLLQC